MSPGPRDEAKSRIAAPPQVWAHGPRVWVQTQQPGQCQLWLGQQGTPVVSWQVHVAVGRSKVRLYVDCRKVAERPIGEAGSSPVSGFVTLGRLAKAQGPRSSSAAVSLGLVLQGVWVCPMACVGLTCSPCQFQLQVLQIMCGDTWADEDRCCELPASVSAARPGRGAVSRAGTPGLLGPRGQCWVLAGSSSASVGSGHGCLGGSKGALSSCLGLPGLLMHTGHSAHARCGSVSLEPASSLYGALVRRTRGWSPQCKVFFLLERQRDMLSLLFCLSLFL